MKQMLFLVNTIAMPQAQNTRSLKGKWLILIRNYIFEMAL